MKMDLSTFSDVELVQFLDSFDHIFCDLDGVVWSQRSGVFQGIKETFYKLLTMNKKIHFVTHNVFKKEEEMFKILNAAVPNLTFTDIVTPASAMIRYLKNIHFDKEIWYLGASCGRERFVQAGFRVSEVPVDLIEESVDAVVKHAGIDNIEIGAVICDFDVNISYVKLLKALVYLQREDVLFFTGSSEISTTFKGARIIGPGSFLNILRQLSERDCTRFGKPSKNLGDYLIDVFDIKDTSRSLFVGDMLDTDIQFGNEIGFQTLLVLTGASRLEDIDAEKAKNLMPKYFLNSLADLGTIIEEKIVL